VHLTAYVSPVGGAGATCTSTLWLGSHSSKRLLIAWDQTAACLQPSAEHPPPVGGRQQRFSQSLGEACRAVHLTADASPVGRAIATCTRALWPGSHSSKRLLIAWDQTAACLQPSAEHPSPCGREVEHLDQLNNPPPPPPSTFPKKKNQFVNHVKLNHLIKRPLVAWAQLAAWLQPYAVHRRPVEGRQGHLGQRTSHTSLL
jgi:hypothetical protein